MLENLEAAQQSGSFMLAVVVAKALLNSKMATAWGVTIRRAVIKQLSEELDVDVKELAEQCCVVLQDKKEAGKEKETTGNGTNEKESLSSTSATLDPAAEARRKKNKKKREAKKRQKAAAKLDDDYYDELGEDSEDDDDHFECNCGFDHSDGPGGMREYTKWLPKVSLDFACLSLLLVEADTPLFESTQNPDATIEDLIKGMNDYTKFAFANPLK